MSTLKDYIDMKGKVALVTGSARGIGMESAKILGEGGASVVITDINREGAEKTAADLKAQGIDAIAFPVDVASEESIANMVEAAMKAKGRIDILVNNAGILSPVKIPDMSVEEWDRIIDVDLRGVHLVSQKVVAHMIAAGNGGRIVNISSQAGQFGSWMAGVHYASAKGGMLALTKSYARYGAPHNITVNAIAPGYMLTDMTRDRKDDPSVIPLKRLGTALDVAQSVFFLCSDLAAYITGATIDLNGGYYMRG